MKFKTLPMLMALSVGAMSAQAESRDEVELLVGSYTQGKSQGIYRLQFDSAKGRITPEPLQVFKTANPSWLTLSKDQSRLFVVNENGKGQRDVVGRASSVAIDPKTNQMTLINQVKTLGEEPTHSSLSADERYLFVANYGVHADPGGSLAVLPINAEGQLQPVTQMSTHPASQVNPERQMSAHVHSVVSSPDGKFVYASDLGADKVFVYQYDPAANADHPLVAADPAFVELPAGSGPRHLLFSKDGKHAYLTTEMSAQVFVFDYDKGRLKQRQALELAHGMPAQNRAAGALHASQDGKFLYVSNRGKANEILVFAINPSNGELTEIQRRSVDGDHPREFALSPNGKFLLIANQMSNAIVVLERDPETGMLGKTVQTLEMDAPSDLKFINRP
ncbi:MULTISPECIES: lactonase family protein [Pseudomonas]|uniref:6-phosphogluconolactonase, cycloisomerase 2 family n=1 Tax=Pseudomonas psychrophila TaxID=122355 RepID=A0ABY0VVB3_9PSED|nr:MULTISPECIES: lactonase family protein [Pseudomonas]KAB0489607.1 lactonase family protein [Pseudomonas psychrophila]KMM98912.1 3-carboxymuconate cyclase [Pseudomonas psychrophila]MDY7580151.1 lactonase family protein [Pseudomonas sp. CCI3.1]MEB0068298.1 lactonase family protein [Pseudomonas sp. CCI3.1]MEB0072935.1 lactonase family protein [Pseudomonas sp. CCI1.4]